MAKKIVVDLEVNSSKGVKDVKDLEKSINSLKDSTQGLKGASKKASDGIEDVTKNGGAIAILDQLTGGLATRFRDTYEATKLFNVSLKGTKKALIATGIGAVVVALGVIVAYWDEIEDFIKGTTRQLELQERVLSENSKIIDTTTELMKMQLQLSEQQGKSIVEDTKEYKKQLFIQKEQYGLLLENYQIQLQKEEALNKEVTIWEKIKIAAAGVLSPTEQAMQITKAVNQNSEKSIEIQDKINELKKKSISIDLELSSIENASTEKRKKAGEDKIAADEKIEADKIAKLEKEAKDRELIKELEANTEEERRVLDLEKEKAKFDEAILLATEQGLSTEELERSQKESLRLMRDGFAQTDLDRTAKIAADEKVIKDKAVSDEIELEAKRVAAKHQALNDISAIFGAESAMGRAALIAKKLMAAQELLIDLGAIKSKATKAIVGSQLNAAESGGAVATGFAKTLALGFPAAIPALIGYLASATGIVAGVMAATKKTKSVASSFGGTGGGGGGSAPSIPSAPSLPPAFNVVGASDTNQLAGAIGNQEQQPVKAYVVSNDVTTAQSMDRSIVDGASI